MSDDLPRLLDRLATALDRIESAAESTRERHAHLRGEVAVVIADLDQLTEAPTDG